MTNIVINDTFETTFDEIFADVDVAKHGSHDQSSHGNWADGSGGGGAANVRDLGSKTDPKTVALYGKGETELFPEGSSDRTTVPFPRAGRSKRRGDYDKAAVSAAITASETSLVDPRQLSASQPMVTKPGVQHYMSDDYTKTGAVFADADQAGNKTPVVYVRSGTRTEAVILSGHHRATAALLRGEPLEAIVVEGGWGEKR